MIPQLIQGMSYRRKTRGPKSLTPLQPRFPSSVFKTSCSMYVHFRIRIPRIYNSPCSPQTELIDEFTESETAALLSTPVPEEYQNSIGIRRASFTWANDSAKLAVTPGGTRRRMFMLHVDEELFFKRGKLNLIVGPTGSGKTSLLMALLGEMHYIPVGPDSFSSLPREGGVAYAAQESWLQNDTIKASAAGRFVGNGTTDDFAHCRTTSSSARRLTRSGIRKVEASSFRSRLLLTLFV